ncbi:MAG: hypothetical protein HOK60_05305 [Planctomycetes bacterium]|nr:hypothetical protein [Planctomycetota bacterium]
MSERRKALKMAGLMNRLLVGFAIALMIFAGVLSVTIPFEQQMESSILLYVSAGLSGVSILAGFWIRYSVIPSTDLPLTMKGVGLHSILISVIVGLHEASGLLWACCSFLYRDQSALAGTAIHIFLVSMMSNAGADLEQGSEEEEAESES